MGFRTLSCYYCYDPSGHPGMDCGAANKVRPRLIELVRLRAALTEANKKLHALGQPPVQVEEGAVSSQEMDHVNAEFRKGGR